MFKEEMEFENILLTVGGHEEASVDYFAFTEVWFHFLPPGIKLPLVNAAGFNVQHIETGLPMRGKKEKNVFFCTV